MKLSLNKLEALPASSGNLTSLRVLEVNANKLQTVPDILAKLKYTVINLYDNSVAEERVQKLLTLSGFGGLRLQHSVSSSTS